MIVDAKLHSADADEEIAALIEALHATEHRLEQLTHGEIDTVANLEGRTVLLRDAQEQLRRSDASRQMAILNALPANIALLNPRGQIISVNEGWRQFAIANMLHGPHNAVNANYLEVCDFACGNDSAEAGAVAAGIRSILIGETKRFSLEYPCHSAAEQRWFLISVTPLPGDPPTGAVVMHLNVTEGKRANRMIEESLQRLNNAQRIGKIGDWGYDISTGKSTWSAQVFDIFGRDPQLGPPRTDDEYAALFDARNLAIMKKGMALAIQSEEAQDYQLVARRPSGGLIYLLETVVPRKDLGGKVCGLLGTIQDISTRKLSELELVASESRYHTLFENMLEGYAYCQTMFEEDQLTDFLFLEANAAFERISGLKDVVGKRVSEVVPGFRESSPELFAMYGRVVQSGEAEKSDSYVPTLGIWLSITVYSPDAGHFVAIFDDISDRIRSVEAVRDSEREQRLLAEQLQVERGSLVAAQRLAKVGSWETDVATMAVNWSEETHRIFGTSPASFSVTHQEFLRLVHPLDRDLVEEAFVNSLDPAIGRGVLKHRLLLAAGQVKFVEERWRVKFDQLRKPLRVAGTCQDITERVQLDETLQKQHAELQTLFDLLPVMIWFKDTKDRIVRVNKRAAEDAGKTVAEIEGKAGIEIYPQNGAAFYADDLEVIRSGVPKLGMISQSPDANGNERWMEVDKVPYFDINHKVIGIAAVSQDITARTRIVNALRDSEEKFRQLADNITDVFWIRSADLSELLYVSPAFEKVWGRSVESMRAEPQRWVEYIHPDDRVRAQSGFARLMEGEANLEMDYRIVRPDGEVRWVHVRGFQVRDTEGKLVRLAGVINDITELRRAMEDLQDLNVSLEQRVNERTLQLDTANRAKSTFLATMSHEIRTPLNGVLGMIELLGLTQLDAQQHATIDIVRQSGRSLARIIDDILDHAKIEAGKLTIRNEVVSLDSVAHAVVDLYSGAASSKGLSLACVVDSNLSKAVWVDPQRLQQILNNFVSNAIKFTDKGYIELRAESITKTRDSEVVHFSVTDTGIGVTPNDLQQLFQPFTQVETQSNRRFGGTGLGLTICRQLTEMMGGTIDMESTPGIGTTLHVILPLLVADPDELPDALMSRATHLRIENMDRRKAPTADEAAREGTLVLVVDDHAVNRLVLRQQIATLGYAVETAEDGLDGLAKWKSGRYGIVLADCNMPVMDGYEMVRQMRAIETGTGRKRTPVIACTANAMADEAEKCLAAGMDDYLSKPLEMSDVAVKLDQWIPLPGATVDRLMPAQLAGPAGDAGPAIDLDILAALTRGNSAKLRELVDVFRRVNDQDAMQLRQAINGHDSAVVKRVTHRIKGAAGMLGAKGLAALAAEIETNLPCGDWRAMADLMPPFDIEIHRVNQHLETVKLRSSEG